MSKHFFILGLPRSRTAWLANLFTHGEDVFCFHDAVRMSKEPPEIDHVLATVDHRYVGVSDNALAFWGDRILSRFPGTPVAVVQREPADCRRSLLELHPELTIQQINVIIEMTQTGLEQVKRRDGCMVIDYDALQSTTVLGEMWEHLVPDVEFPRIRATLMQTFNVQIQQDVYRAMMSPAFARIAQKEMSCLLSP